MGSDRRLTDRPFGAVSRWLILAAVIAVFVWAMAACGADNDGLSDREKTAAAKEQLRLVARAEQAARVSTGHFTDSLAELVRLEPRLTDGMTVPLAVELSVDASGSSYSVQITGDTVALVRLYEGGKLLSYGCRILRDDAGTC
jgi:hypothetical protein